MSDFDYQQLDEVIHSRIRLAIMAALLSVDEAEFTFLRDTVKSTDGNLSIQLRKLEEAGYVSTTKSFVSRKPVTRSRLTAKGHKAFELYVRKIEEFLKQGVQIEKKTR
jgi:DNA-binding MarR family transcriptional regulator